MDQTAGAPKRLDLPSLEIIIAAALISLYDFLLSDAMSVPAALQNSTLGHLRYIDRIASGLEYLVPAVVFAALIVLWLTRRYDALHRVAVGYLIWVTLRLVIKIILMLVILVSRPQKAVGVLLKDTLVLWLVIILLFGIWYWIIDGGGPRVRRLGTSRRFDLAFPQRMTVLPGWQDWKARFLDYFFLGFAGSTQFSLGETAALSIRVKLLFTLQVMLSFAVIVFTLSIATGLVH